MKCKESTTYTCPVCGHVADEIVYVFKNGDVIGCEKCVKEKSPEDMINDEVEW
jgi:transcription elongation factor Elf1